MFEDIRSNRFDLVISMPREYQRESFGITQYTTGSPFNTKRGYKPPKMIEGVLTSERDLQTRFINQSLIMEKIIKEASKENLEERIIVERVED